MKFIEKDNFIIRIIKVAPPILIIILVIIATLYIVKQHSIDLELNKKDFKEIYISSNKQRIQTNLDTISNYINHEFTTSRKQLKENIKTQVNIAFNIMNTIYKEYKDSKSKEEITKLIKTALRNITYNEGRGYFFIYNLEGENIFHPTKPYREGKNFFNAKDVNGTLIVQESIKVANGKNKEGFQTWFFNKPNQTFKEYEKIGFIKKFEPYNWYLGTGEYVKDFEEQLKKKILKHINIIQYTNDGYIFVLDDKGYLILNKNKNLIGKKISNINNELLSNKINKFLNSKKKRAFIEYEIIDINEKPYTKVSYLKKIEKTNWIIGTGFNLDNINKFVNEKQVLLDKKHDENISMLGLLAFTVTVLLLIISYFISKFLEKKFIEYKKRVYKNEVKRFENMLKELRLILDNLPMMIIYKDTKNNILTVNKHTANSLGIKIEDLQNVPVKDVYPDDYKKYYQDDLEVINTKKPKIAYIEKYESKDGERIVESSKIPIFDDKGNVINIILFMIDITEKEQLKQDSENKEKLLYQQSKLATMGEMISNIAHQWRQPLSTISTAATGMKLQKEMDCLNDEQFKSAVDSINDSAQYLSHTIDDFRDFFKPNQNKYTKFFISRTIDKTIKLIITKLQTLNIEIVKDIEDIEIHSLENEIIQVLINILNNARDELLKVKDKRLIFIKTYTKNNKLFIEIKDNAKGIKEENLDKIFEAYFTTKPDHEGTGIGLYICKDILNKILAGNITVKNETYFHEGIEYKGAKFTVELSY